MAILNIEAWQAQPLRTPYGHLSLHGPHKGQPQTESLTPLSMEGGYNNLFPGF